MTAESQRVRVTVSGRVQGVGFRPAVYRHAMAAGLTGFVANTTSGVVIEVEGAPAAIARFVEQLKSAPPPSARITGIRMEEMGESGGGEPVFRVMASRRSGDLVAGMPPDMATCEACRQELMDPVNRRYRYPFINCTDCGPRFTIIEKLPYDRERTTMAPFVMCGSCREEFEAVANRRFEAQPNACGICGPTIRLQIARGKGLPGDPIEAAAICLRQGGLVAVKGIGGYHLCADARNESALRLLRTRKSRPHKSLAVMYRTEQEIEADCILSAGERQSLVSPARPIVVLRRRAGGGLSRLISPDTRDVGVFLPYAPLHHLLLEAMSPLVMTSGNLAEEPIVKDEDELKHILGSVADVAIVHDRVIARRCDDSVLRHAETHRILMRRSRGLVPDPIPLPAGLEEAGGGGEILAVGAELKNTFCVTRRGLGFVSQHIGDLTDRKTQGFFQESVKDLQSLLEVNPTVVAHDLHPDYLATRHAMKMEGVRRVAVQHHHAHIAACMAENGLKGPVIGVAFDGLGLGGDGTIWGGEFLLGDYRSFRRMAHLKNYPMPGGDQATLHPDRMAYACLVGEGVDEETAGRLLPALDQAQRIVMRRMVEQRVRAPLTSSAGRLFDAVSAMLGLCHSVTYEGQAAIRLQTAAEEAADGGADAAGIYEYRFGGKREAASGKREGASGKREAGRGKREVGSGEGEQGEGSGADRVMSDVELSAVRSEGDSSECRRVQGVAGAMDTGEMGIIDFGPMLRQIVAESLGKRRTGEIALQFHRTLAQCIGSVCGDIRHQESVGDVVLSGGVFQNNLLADMVVRELNRREFQVYSHRLLPPNDACIAFGQAVVALANG